LKFMIFSVPQQEEEEEEELVETNSLILRAL
jgi:hypothetical protein